MDSDRPSIHLVGIGGAGMSGLARIYLQRGWSVSGSDACPSPLLDGLRAAGCRITSGDPAELPPRVESVVHSLAVPAEDPQLVAARAAGIPIEPYAAALGRLSRERLTVAVAGTHGKTTTTSMLVEILEAARRGAGHVVGASLRGGEEPGARWGEEDAPFVVEACEYGGSFQRLDPQGAVLINVEPDHLDFYGTFEGVLGAFREFAERVPATGFLVAHEACATLLGLQERSNGPSLRLVEEPGGSGSSRPRGVRARELELVAGRWSFRIESEEGIGPPISLATPGRHNVGNALLAAAAALELGVSPEDCALGLNRFRCAERRFQVLYEEEGRVVIDDYGHHPTEITATLNAVRERYPEHRLVVCYQPHQASRTRVLEDGFVESLRTADACVLPEIYYARDSAEDRANVSSRILVERLLAQGREAAYAASFETAGQLLLERDDPPIVYLVMGAGDVFRVAQGLVRVLSRRGSP